jgi:hypothetical protein
VSARNTASSHNHVLFDHLIRPRQHRRGDREAEGLRGLEVDYELELRRLLDGEVGRFGAAKNPVHIVGRNLDGAKRVPRPSPIPPSAQQPHFHGGRTLARGRPARQGPERAGTDSGRRRVRSGPPVSLLCQNHRGGRGGPSGSTPIAEHPEISMSTTIPPDGDPWSPPPGRTTQDLVLRGVGARFS